MLPPQDASSTSRWNTARWCGLVIATVHVLLGLRVVLDDSVMHDEGQAMYGFSRSLSEAFLPCLFFQKTKPALALVYALPARLGFVPYLVMHLAVSTLAVYLLARVAASMNLRRAWLPPLVLGLSPLFLWNGATGISNGDGVVGIVLFLYLLEVRRWRFVAGLVLGALPWVRFESAVFCALAAIFVGTRDRDRRFFVGLLVWPVLYTVGGAFYHRDPLWLVTIKPAATGLQAWHAAEAQAFAEHDARSAIESFLCVSPALTVLFFCRLRALSTVERLLAVFSLSYFGLYLATHFRALPIGPLFVVGFTARNAGLPIAAAALLLGRAAESIEDAGQKRARVRELGELGILVGIIALGVFAKRSGAGPGVLLSGVALALAVAATRAGRASLGSVAIAGLVVLGPWIAHAAMTREGYSREAAKARRSPAELARALEALDPALLRAGVLTNAHTLPLYLARTGRLAGVRVRFMVGTDMNEEMTAQTNPRNGQREAVLAALPRATFGDAILPAELQPEKVPIGTVIATFDDPRNELLLPPAIWTPRLRVVSHEGGLLLAVVTP